jgi:GNAT superfamily N-acetyltransferase
VTLDATGLTALCADALPEERLTTEELATCCFGPGSEVLGDPDGAAVLTIGRQGATTSAWLLLLAVHPVHRRKGRGRALLDAVVTRTREKGASELHLGNAAPRYVWPGVDFRYTGALSLFEAGGFDPYGAECNMAIATDFRADPPGGVAIERETGDGAAELARRVFPDWVDETTRAVDAGTCWVARSGDATLGFACHSVNRSGWVGPMMTDPDRQRGGVGRALLASTCADLGGQGLRSAEIAWVGPVGFYAKCGARVSRVFRTARLRL